MSKCLRPRTVRVAYRKALSLGRFFRGANPREKRLTRPRAAESPPSVWQSLSVSAKLATFPECLQVETEEPNCLSRNASQFAKRRARGEVAMLR